MKRGDVINGYRILADFTTAGGGLSKWSFAERDGREYFIKQFLSPTYPIDGAPGSAETKANKIKQCEQFEAHHRQLMSRLAGHSIEGGNLVIALEFFRHKSHFYKVTEKVDIASIDVPHIAMLPMQSRIRILLSVAHSLQILHHRQIVHGDLKPSNILIRETGEGRFSTKLIDFDNSFLSTQPAVADEMVGDVVYYSPELGQYIGHSKTVGPSDLTTKSDIFALGLIYCEYLTGELPTFDEGAHRYPYVAILNGARLEFGDSSYPAKLAKLITSMLTADPLDRPVVSDVHRQIKELDLSSLPARDMGKPIGLSGALARHKTSSPTEADTDTKPSRLRGRLAKRSGH